ncbi:DNA-binding protein [Mycolicibacterium austroafricanum]|uniref:DNA-binding protein n=1 Tax=Mycolicibacterium austroafricanum TaxID=39687 RepID=A0ABT8HIX2_MYCAO|nr:DNA-binding protein [Mycolicibacterium austroafricanum]MDN4520720.1 DNA-binding protein [Mycolicibacterium austroafricanum]
MTKAQADGEQWAKDLVARAGKAMKAARGSKSAAWLSERTAELGYRISPTVIAKLDSGHRGSVLSVTELVVLAAALNTSPVNLVYPGPYQNAVEILPGRNSGEFNAAQWFSGIYSYLGNDGPGPAEDPAEQWRANTETLHQWRNLDELMTLRDEMDNPDHIASINRQIKAISERLRIAIPTEDVDLIVVGEEPADDSDA